MIEAPGTAGNGILEATTSITEQTRMVLDLIEHLGINKAHIFAFSYATAISVELCDMWSGVQSLSIACGVPGIPSSGRKATFKMIAAAANNNEDFAKTFIDSLLSDDPAIPKAAAIRKAVINEVKKFDYQRINSFIENSIRLLAYKPTNLENINAPCLILTGESDPYATGEITKEFFKKLRHAHYVSIKKADHMLHLQQPEKAAKALITLAKRHIETVSLLKTLEE